MNNTAHTNRGILLIVIPNVLILNIVVIKFIAPNNDDIDVKCNENIAKSTEGPECDCIPDNGGYLFISIYYYIVWTMSWIVTIYLLYIALIIVKFF